MIVDELLRFARSGAQPAPGERADIARVLESVRDELAPEAEWSEQHGLDWSAASGFGAGVARLITDLNRAYLEAGKLQVAVTLAPTMPPRVQFLSVRPAPATPARTETCR